MKINGNLSFPANGLGEFRNFLIERLATAPTIVPAEKGRLYFNTTDNLYYFSDGSTWVAVGQGSGLSNLQTEVNAIETTLGAAINPDGTYNSLTGFVTNVALNSPVSFTDAINQISAYSAASDQISELKDVAITSLANNNLLKYNSTSTKWENVVIGSTSGIQGYDAGLAALASFNSNGILVQTANDTFSARSLVAPSEGFTITNADGVSGNPTFVLANDLAALEALTTTGLIARTATNAITTRTLTSGSASRVVITNGNAVSADPVIDLATVTNSNTGTFQKITTDTYGRVTGTTPVISSDITSLVDSSYVNTTGDTLTGTLTFTSGTITGVPLPVNGTDVANKNYVDSAVVGLAWKNPVRVASVFNLTLASSTIVDGVTLVLDDRVLVKNQTTTSENGIYTFNGTGLVRASDMDAPIEFSGATVLVQSGATNANTGWTQTASVTTVGTSAVTWVQFSGSTSYNWSTGLNLTGNTVSVNMGAGITELPTNEVGIDLYDSVNGAIILTTTGSARSSVTGSKLHLLLTPSGGLSQSSTGLTIGSASVTNAMLSNSSITLAGNSGTNNVLSLGGTFSILGNSTQGVSTASTANTLTITVQDATTAVKGVSSFDSNFFSVTSGVVGLNASLDDLSNVSLSDTAATGDILTKTAGDWQTVSRVALVGSTSIGNHSDTLVSSVSSGNTLIYSTANTKFVNRPIYFLYTGASASSHTVTHNLGQKYCNVTVVDSSNDNVIIPESIVYNTANQLTVTFNLATAATIIVMGVNGG